MCIRDRPRLRWPQRPLCRVAGATRRRLLCVPVLLTLKRPFMNNKNHFTTRRGFIAASGFGGVSLYGLWAAYGAAPGPLALLGLGGAHSEAEAPGAAQPHDAPAAPDGHGGHGAAAAGPNS